MSQRFISILILFLMTLAQLATDIYLPSFPNIMHQLATTPSYVQLTFSIFLGGFALSQLLYGPLSDRFGRKPFLLIGVGLYLLMSIVAAQAHSILILLTARLLQGIGAGACSVIPRAMMRDCFTGKALEKITIYQSIIWSFVPISAPLLGSYIQHYFNWRANFIVLAIISTIALLLCFILKETHQQKESRLQLHEVYHHYKNILTHHAFYPYLICAVCIIAMYAAFNVFAPLMLKTKLNLTTLQYGWSVFVVAITFTAAASLNRLLIHKLTPITSMTFGVTLIIIANLLLISISFITHLSAAEFLLPICLLQIGSAFIFPSAAAKSMELFANKAGKAAALFGSCIFLGGTLASALTSILPHATLTSLIIVFLLFTIALSIAFTKILFTHKSQRWRITHAQ